MPTTRSTPTLAAALLLWTACVDGVDEDDDDDGPVTRVRIAAGADVAADDPPPTPLTLDELPAGLLRFDLGLLALSDGASADVLVDVDAAVRSFTLLVSGHAGADVLVDRVVDPAGGLVVDPAEPDEVSRQARRLSRGFPAPFLSKSRVVPKRDSGAFVVPASPDVPLVAGTWRARVRQGVVDVDDDGAVTQAPLDRPVHVQVLVDTRAPAARSRLTIALHFTAARGVTATTAATDPLVQRALATVASTFDAAGIDIEIAPFLDVDDGEAFQTLTLIPGLCDDGDLQTLLRSLAPTPGAIDVVFVERVRCVVRAGVEVDGFSGLAAAIPGDVLVEGGPHGGVVIALGVVDEASAGVVLAHEIGHLLGLFHTQEQASGADPLLYDVVEDTADVPSLSDNLMYFAPETSTSLSAGQAQVLRRSPWVSPAD